ncbi:MAG: hypothetical protein AAF657_00165 [Acidobacteriota bacterium]
MDGDPKIDIAPEHLGTTKQVTAVVPNTGPNFWQVDYSSPDGNTLCGSVNPNVQTEGGESPPPCDFVIYRWKPSMFGKKRIKGLLYQRPGLPGEDPDPGTWEAEEGGDGGEC